MFKKTRETSLPEYNATGIFYVHEKTGMEVFHVKNSSQELTCCFQFATPSRDDMGVAHILEHTVLCGSERYPVKDPFSQVLNSSPNTFLNAMTFTDKTIYPFSSPLKKDFDILFGIYADAVFSPLLRKTSFEQEGVRYFNGSFDGVVYNEMTGALNSCDDIAQSFCMRKLWEGTPFMYESGGDPLHIADLTYEEYKARYRSWYSPSNCRLLLVGDLDARQYLDMLEDLYLNDENLSKWDDVRYVNDASLYQLSDRRDLRDHIACAQEDSSSVILTWLTKPSQDPLELLTLTLLTDILLGNPGAPLYKAITDSDLGEDLNPVSGTDPDFPLMPFIVGFTGAKENAEDEIESYLVSAVERIAREGLDPYQVQAAIKRQEFRLLEQSSESEPLGIRIAFKVGRTWLRGMDPEDALNSKDVLETLKKRISGGRYLENWMLENLVNNHRRCLLTVSYDSSFTEDRNRILSEKLRRRLEKVDSADFERQRQEFETFINTEDSEQSLRCIPRIRISDMPEKVPHYEYMEDTQGKSTLLRYPLFSNSIVYLNMAFDVKDLSLEEKKLLPLLIRVMQMTGTRKRDYVELGSRIKFLTGSFSISSQCGLTSDGSVASDVVVRTKVLSSDIRDAFSLFSEILTESDISNRERIKASLTDLITDFEDNYTYSANAFASLYACSRFSHTALETDITGGNRTWLYMKELKDDSESPEYLQKALEDLFEKIFVSSRLTSLIGCEQSFMDEAVSSYRQFESSLPDRLDVSGSSFYDTELSFDRSRAVLKLSSGPAYNAMCFPISDYSMRESVSAMLFNTIVSNSFLWDAVRGKGGAYGVYATTELQEKICSYISYRDPLVGPTYSAFIQAFDQSVSSDDIEYTQVTIIGKELRSLSSQQKCYELFKRYRYRLDDSLYRQRREILLGLTVSDMQSIAMRLKQTCLEYNSQVCVCGSELSGKQDCDNTCIVELPL